MSKTRRTGTKKPRKWSIKYKRSINCKRPKGFSQKQHCKYGRKTMRGGSKKEFTQKNSTIVVMECLQLYGVPVCGIQCIP